MRSALTMHHRQKLDLDALCRTLVAELTALSTRGDDGAGVVAIFDLLAAPPHFTPHCPELLGDAFQRLDERPSWYGTGAHCQDWHALLRRTRNSPMHGPALFATWSAD